MMPIICIASFRDFFSPDEGDQMFPRPARRPRKVISRPWMKPIMPPMEEPEMSSTPLQDYFDKEVYRSTKKKPLKFSEAPPGYVLSTDKAVYRPGEPIRVQVYFYDKFDKSPKGVPSEMPKSNPKVTLRDARGQPVKTVKKFGQKHFAMTFEVGLDEKLPGGFYQLEFGNAFLSLVQRQTVFVLSFESPNELLSLDVNKDFVTGGDQIIAEATLKLLGRAPRQNELSNLSVSVKVVSSAKTLQSLDVLTNENGAAIASLRLPKDLSSKTYTILASLQFNGRLIQASKDLKVSSLEDLAIDFSVSTGKWVLGKANLVYFQAFATKDKKAEFVIENAQVIKKSNQKKTETNLKQISSEENGMGKFTIKVHKQFSYYLRVFKQGESRDFLVVDGAQHKSKSKSFSNILMKLTARVFDQNSVIRFELQKLENIMVESVWVAIQNKTKVLYESEVDFFQTKARVSVPIHDLDFPSGGALTLQVFRKKSFGTPDQEALIYVYPRSKLPVKSKPNKSVYLPNEKVHLKFSSSEKDLLWGIVVSDESSFLQLEKKRLPPSLITKVFLENELFFPSKEFQGAHRYIDWFFDSGSAKLKKAEVAKKRRLLDLLLGNQKWRLFFLAGDKLRRIIRSNDSLGKDKKGHFEYLLARRLSDLKPKFRFFRRRFRRRGRFPMAMNAAPRRAAFAKRAVPEKVIHILNKQYLAKTLTV